LSIPLNPTLLNLAQKALLVIVIFSVTVVLARLAVGFINLYTKRAEGVLPSTTIFINLTKLLIFLIGVLIILQSLGISITPILTALGVGGLAVALALQDTLSNLFAGLHIIASKQVKTGDYIRLDTGEEGYVTDITWRNTTIRALPNNMIVVPNSRLASAIITNYYQPEREMTVRIDVGVSYDSDLAKVEKITMEVAREVIKEIPGGVTKFEPFIRFHTFADSSINFTVFLRAKEFVEQYPLKHEFIKRLHERYQKEGIEIPFPIRTVYMKEKLQR
jgi:small-conductance mechanosensitive channel